MPKPIDFYSSDEILKIFKAKAVDNSVKCRRCQQHIPANEGVDVMTVREGVDMMTVRDGKYLHIDIKLCCTCDTECSIHGVMLPKQKIEEIKEMIRHVKTRTEWDKMVRRLTLDYGIDS